MSKERIMAIDGINALGKLHNMGVNIPSSFTTNEIRLILGFEPVGMNARLRTEVNMLRNQLAKATTAKETDEVLDDGK